MRQHDLMALLEAPLVSEKSSFLADNARRVTFRVRPSATKGQIKRSVEMLFEVKVESVNVVNVKGKRKRFGRFAGARSDWKKAYVKLKPGFDIDFVSA